MEVEEEEEVVVEEEEEEEVERERGRERGEGEDKRRIWYIIYSISTCAYVRKEASFPPLKLPLPLPTPHWFDVLYHWVLVGEGDIVLQLVELTGHSVHHHL